MKRLLMTIGLALGALGAGLALWMRFAPAADVTRALMTFERSRAGLVAKEIDVEGFRIPYLEGGSGEPLLLLHGIGGEKDHWTRIAKYLTPRFRVIAIDLPGFGESSRRNDEHYTSRDQVARVHAIVGALELSVFHLGGHSMGGLISAKYAATYPSEVKTLWLISPGGVGAGPTGRLANLKPGDDVPLIAGSEAEIEDVMGWTMSKPPFLPAAMKHVLGERAIADHDLHVRIFHEITVEWAAEPLERTVAGLETPTRIVWGEDDRLLPVANAETLHAAMPESSVLRLPGIGHAPQIEAPETVAEDYLAFENANGG